MCECYVSGQPPHSAHTYREVRLLMSVSADEARYIIARQYPGQKWRDKVKRMSDKQCLAIYFRMLSEGKLK